jgi:hypothetical protein
LLWREYIATGVRGREGQVNGQRRGSSSGGLGVIAAVSARVQRGPGPTRRVRVVEQMKAHGWWEVERAGTRGGRVGVGVQSARIVFVRSTCWGLGMGEGQNRSSAQPPTTSMRARGWRVARWAALQREGQSGHQRHGEAAASGPVNSAGVRRAMQWTEGSFWRVTYAHSAGCGCGGGPARADQAQP